MQDPPLLPTPLPPHQQDDVKINVQEPLPSENAFNKERELESDEIKALGECANSSACAKGLLLSIKLPFKFFGGRIYIHWTVIPLVGYLFYLLSWIHGVGTYILVSLAISAITCLSLFVHELGHVMVYYYMYNSSLKFVALHVLGGFTLPKRMIEDKKASMAFVSVAGPALNFVLAGIFAIPHYTVDQDDNRVLYILFYYAYLFNIVVGIFNLLPIWPMDGGRAIRSFALLFCNEKTAVYSTSVVSLIFLLGVFGWTVYTRDYFTMSMLLIFVLALVFEVNRIRSGTGDKNKEEEEEGHTHSHSKMESVAVGTTNWEADVMHDITDERAGLLHPSSSQQ